MTENRFPKQGTEGFYIYFPNVVRVKISKKWVDRTAYTTPTQVATVRVTEVITGEAYKEGSKIIFDEPEQFIPGTELKDVVRSIFK